MKMETKETKKTVTTMRDSNGNDIPLKYVGKYDKARDRVTRRIEARFRRARAVLEQTVAVVGREGELDIAKDLVLSNTTATATAAVLSFAFGPDGIAPITVGGKVVNTSGTKLLVDVGAVLTKVKHHRLVRCAGWEGPEIADVTFTGACAEKVRLARDAQGLLLTVPPPLVVIVR